jgi:hypothetical protein
LAYFLFIDESGHDHRESPYEVLAGIAVEDSQVWPLITELNDLEEKHFGIRYSKEKVEIKGKKFLKKKVFRLAQQLPAISEQVRTPLARSCILDGGSAGKRELTALAQAKLVFVQEAFTVCSAFECYAFASIVHPAAPKSGSDMLRKDYSYLFERLFYFLEDHGNQQGIVVFDELEKSQSHILLGQMEEYFIKTVRGQNRAKLIIPEPFFVHSDLTSIIQVADLSAYIISWGLRYGQMTGAVRHELKPYADLVSKLRYRATRHIMGNPNFQIWSFQYIDDLRCQEERECEI